MKRVVTPLGMAFLLIVSGCGGAAVSEDDAKTAFMVGFASAMSVGFKVALEGEVPGVSIDEETNDVTLDGYDVSEIGGGGGYTSISGTIRSEDSSLIADFELEGGPVETMGFTLDLNEVSDLPEGSVFKTTATVNGKEMEIEISEEDAS